jgi:hypothetical protein
MIVRCNPVLTSVKHQSTVREVPAHYPAWKRRRAPASMLAEHGVRRSRLEIPWGGLSVDEKSQDLTEFDATLLAVRTAGTRPAVAIVPHLKKSLNLPLKAFQ